MVIHKKLFDKVFDHAGKIRDYDIYKKEWALKGDTVDYTPFDQIRTALFDCFAKEENFSYDGLSVEETIRHLEGFAAKVWKVHPFFEGNTRTVVVFLLKFFKTLGYSFDGEQFAMDTWYFRNALVRANYHNDKEGIEETTEYLDLFFDNLLSIRTHELKNRDLRIP